MLGQSILDQWMVNAAVLVLAAVLFCSSQLSRCFWLGALSMPLLYHGVESSSCIPVSVTMCHPCTRVP